jgi:phosphatidate cytidylyltransferase
MSDPSGGGSAKWSDLLPRTLSAVALVPIALGLIYQGGAWFQVLVAFMGVIMAFEYATIAHRGSEQQFALHLAAVLLAVLVTPASGWLTATALIVALAIVSNLLLVFSGAAASNWQRIGIVYVAMPLVALLVLRGDDSTGLAAVLFLLLLVWFADTLAYFAGRILGGPKLAPRFSPKKTWAGLAGAVVGASMVALLFVIKGYASGALVLMSIAALLACWEQVGDIFESAFKRAHNTKDSGILIPGHGGMLDRVDGLLAVSFAAAVIGLVHEPLSPAAGVLFWAQ